MRREKRKQGNRRTGKGYPISGHGTRGIAGKEYTAGDAGADRLLEKIFKEVIYYEDDIVQMENRLAVEIERLAAGYPGRLDGKEREMFKAAMYEAVFAAEAETFWIGVRYARRLSKRL